MAKKNGIDYAKIDVLNVAPNLQEQMLLQGQVDAIAIFTATSYMNLVALELDPEKDFRWIYYADSGVDLYSNGVMVSQKLAKEKPEAVKGLVRAINRALKETMRQSRTRRSSCWPRKEALINKDIEKRRLIYVYKTLIATPDEAEFARHRRHQATHGWLRRRRHIAKSFELPSKPKRPQTCSAAHFCRRRPSACWSSDRPTRAAAFGRWRETCPMTMRELHLRPRLPAADAAVASAHDHPDRRRADRRGRSGSDRCRWRAGVGDAGAGATRTTTPGSCARARSARPASRWKSGCTTGAGAVGRSLSGRRGVVCAQRARRRRRRDGALHPRPGADRPADRSRRGRAGGARCRRAGRFCGRDARPQSAWSMAPRSRSSTRCRPRRARRSRKRLRAHAAAGRRADCAGGCGR